jgi:hypothetical protein
MKFAPYVLAAAIVGTVTGCAEPYYSGSRYGYGPDYAYAPPSAYYPSRYGYTSKWDYYRHYQGSTHPGPERYP